MALCDTQIFNKFILTLRFKYGGDNRGFKKGVGVKFQTKFK